MFPTSSSRDQGVEKEEREKINTDIGFLQGGRVVDTVTSDSDDGSEPLATLDNDELLLGWRAGKDDLRVVAQYVVQVVAVHVTQFSSVNDGRLGQPLVHLFDGDVEPLGHVLHRFVTLRDDSDGFGDGFGSDGVVSGHHDDWAETRKWIYIIIILIMRRRRRREWLTFDAGRAALGDGVGDSSAGRVDHGHEADETESGQWEVGVVGVESVALRELVQRQMRVAETEDALAETAQLHVGHVEGVSHLVVEWLLHAVDEDGRADVEDPFGGSFHCQEVAAVVLVLVLVDRHLVFVGRVERDFADLLVARPDRHRLARRQLDAFEQSRFRRVAVHLALQNRDVILAGLEFGPAAKSGNARKRFPAAASLVVLGTCRERKKKHVK